MTLEVCNGFPCSFKCTKHQYKFSHFFSKTPTDKVRAAQDDPGRSWPGQIWWKQFQPIKERFPLLRPKLYLPYSVRQAIATL